VTHLAARAGHGLAAAGALELEVHEPLNEQVVARGHLELKLGRVAALLRDALHALVQAACVADLDVGGRLPRDGVGRVERRVRLGQRGDGVRGGEAEAVDPAGPTRVLGVEAGQEERADVGVDLEEGADLDIRGEGVLGQ